MTYLSGHYTKTVNGKSVKDTTYKTVVAWDTTWLKAHAWYYDFKTGMTDATYTKGLVQEQLTQPITVQNTYCPSGQNRVALWKVQTLPVGEWVFFLKGHAPSDVRKNSKVMLIPVRKSVCGNWLLPPPAASPAPKPTTSALKPIHPGKPTCVPTSTNIENNCTHKQVRSEPIDASRHRVVQVSPSYAVGRDKDKDKIIKYPKPTPSPSSSSDGGVGGLGTKGVAPKPTEAPATQQATQPAPKPVATPSM